MTPDELQACSTETAAAIIAGNRLIARLNVEGALGSCNDNVDTWLLYAWTSDSPAAAEMALDRALDLDPESELAIAGKQWVSGIHSLVKRFVEQNDRHSIGLEQAEFAEELSDESNSLIDDTINERPAEAVNQADSKSETEPTATTENQLPAQSLISGSSDDTDEVAASDEDVTEQVQFSDAANCEPAPEAVSLKLDDTTPAAELNSEPFPDSQTAQDTHAIAQAEQSSAEEIPLETFCQRALEQVGTQSSDPSVLEAGSNLASEATTEEAAATHPNFTLNDDIHDSLQQAMDELSAGSASDTPVSERATDPDESLDLQIVDNIIDITQSVQTTVEPTATETLTTPFVDDNTDAQTSGQPVALVVDNSPTARKLASMILSRDGFKVLAANDGVDALKILSEQQPDVILSSIEMPQLGGYKLCKIIKKNAKTKSIPFLLVSGKDGVLDKMRGKLVGCSGYITKPFESADLIRTVREQLPAVANVS